MSLDDKIFQILKHIETQRIPNYNYLLEDLREVIADVIYDYIKEDGSEYDEEIILIKNYLDKI